MYDRCIIPRDAGSVECSIALAFVGIQYIHSLLSQLI